MSIQLRSQESEDNTKPLTPNAGVLLPDVHRSWCAWTHERFLRKDRGCTRDSVIHAHPSPSVGPLSSFLGGVDTR